MSARRDMICFFFETHIDKWDPTVTFKEECITERQDDEIVYRDGDLVIHAHRGLEGTEICMWAGCQLIGTQDYRYAKE